ncbi:DNA modification methylase [Sphingomonas rubra]|uniref:site-specific DNA-methyltransferase (adenine-specific) n=2 Tax=Sphingomonas rubra TaxID=634430 RepID=A0A1I5S771_9SPHN|nr:DNA modification methylase [Sphingomonas rubra]
MAAIIAEANARADEAEERLAQQAQDYTYWRSVAANDPKPATRPVRVGKKGRYPNALFIGALTHRFQTARQLHAKLLHSGVSKGSVYARYQRLADDPASGVEGDDFSYRLKAPDRVKKTALAKRSIKPRATRKASNDNKVSLVRRAINDPARPVLVHSDGLAMLRTLDAGSVDLMLTDLPYGLTGLPLDPVIDVQDWMAEMLRVVTDRGAIVAFASGSFSHCLTDAGIDFLKDRLVWHKPRATGQQLLRHMQAHEDILIFSKGTVSRNSTRQMTFNPQNTGQTPNYPRTVLQFCKDKNNVHPFQKPVALLEYLIKTYSNPGELVVDPTMGSGSAAIAAINCQRAFMGAENGVYQDGRSIFDLAKERIDRALIEQG